MPQDDLEERRERRDRSASAEARHPTTRRLSGVGPRSGRKTTSGGSSRASDGHMKVAPMPARTRPDAVGAGPDLLGDPRGRRPPARTRRGSGRRSPGCASGETGRRARRPGRAGGGASCAASGWSAGRRMPLRSRRSSAGLQPRGRRHPGGRSRSRCRRGGRAASWAEVGDSLSSRRMPGVPPVKLAQDRRQNGRHREARERRPARGRPGRWRPRGAPRAALPARAGAARPARRSARPAGVSSTRRLVRANSGVPSAASNWAICRLSAGWATASASAARRKWSCRATSWK